MANQRLVPQLQSELLISKHHWDLKKFLLKIDVVWLGPCCSFYSQEVSSHRGVVSSVGSLPYTATEVTVSFTDTMGDCTGNIHVALLFVVLQFWIFFLNIQYQRSYFLSLIIAILVMITFVPFLRF